MGTISEKLTYLSNTKQQIKKNLNKFGSNITENDTFRSYSNVINDIYDKLPKVSANGSNFSLEKAQNGKLDSFGMDGNTEQTTYSGKNLFNKDGTFQQGFLGDTGDVVYSAQSVTAIDYIPVEQNKRYIGSYDVIVNNTEFRGVAFYDENKNYISRARGVNLITPNNCKFMRVYFYNPNNMFVEQFPSYIQNIQIEQGETATSFEPYCGGTPSPSPDYPQEVKVVENKQNINVHGKNLISKQITSTTKNGVTITNNENGTYTLNGKATANVSFDIYVSELNLPTGEYILSGCPSGGSASTYKIAWNVGGVTNNDFGNGSSYNGSVNNRSVWITIYNNYQCNNLIFKPMIEKGSTATEYEPYQSQDYEIDLLDYELCKIEDYKDVIFKNNQLSEYYDNTLDEDSWYIKKNIGKVVLDTSNITLRSNYTNIEYAEITKPNDFIGKGNYDDYNVYCSHAISDIKNAIQYAWDSTYRIGKITNKATTDNLWLGFSKGTGLDNIKTALNGAVIYYVLATPTYETITNETLISQLEAIETHTGTNIFEVSNENNVLPSLNVKRLKELEKLS